MGANKCLLLEEEDGALEDLMKDEVEKVNQWFQVVKRWEPRDVDNEQLAWIQ